MRDVFPGFYKPTPDELTELWSNALVVLDTNALFNLFRYTNSTREAFLQVLASKRERLWIPHQVGLEFQLGRLGVIEDQEKAFTDLLTKSKAALSAVTSDVGALRNHPTLDLDELRTTVQAAIETIARKIEATRQKYHDEVIAPARHDSTTDTITELYLGKVGPAYADDRLAEIYEVGATRYEAKRPPGYKDKSKPEPSRYGDLVLWFQILDKAESDSTSVIFVGDDQKEDWWREFKGRKIGPRIELVDEFRDRTGKRIYFLTPYALMELAKQFGDATISTDAVKEIEVVSKAQASLTERASEREFRHSKLAEGDYARYPTEEVVLTLRQLNDARDRHENLLREKLAAMRELGERGLEESSEYAALRNDLARHRRHVVRYSASIKEAEFELMHRRSRDLLDDTGFDWDYPTEDQVDLARFLLVREGVPARRGADWGDASGDEVAALLLELRKGTVPSPVARALRQLHDPKEGDVV